MVDGGDVDDALTGLLSPSSTPSPAASPGLIMSSGRRSRLSDVVVSVNEELRKLCAGDVASLKGWR
ncbi:MAG TPA: hypothetical protein VEH77_14580, partial [Roseiarcus sp.]|nr:hypothetical protein [Roseiarcus sp.]